MKIPTDLYFSFPGLQYLDLFQCSLEGDGPRFKLPSLRHLLYSPYKKPLSTGDIRLFNLIVKTLVSVTCDLATFPFLPRSIRSSSSVSFCFSARLYDLDRSSTQLIATKHLRLWYDQLESEEIGEEQMEQDVEQLGIWTELIDGAPLLETFVLHPHEAGIEHPSLLECARKGLLEVCQRRGVKVIWQERPYIDGFWDEVTPYFIRMVERRSPGLN
jgi:hypothetical protein